MPVRASGRVPPGKRRMQRGSSGIGMMNMSVSRWGADSGFPWAAVSNASTRRSETRHTDPNDNNPRLVHIHYKGFDHFVAITVAGETLVIEHLVDLRAGDGRETDSAQGVVES
ncbi:hypothetical protein B0H12DRAFT_1123770 [Mycena haematopus]|nr:hypothetical protein B0H12DRAFT_1123770 [Mycena haematopus]